MPENLTLISHCLLSLYRRVHDMSHCRLLLYRVVSVWSCQFVYPPCMIIYTPCMIMFVSSSTCAYFQGTRLYQATDRQINDDK